MIKKALLIGAAIIFTILTFVTDYGLYLLLALIMGFVTWLLAKSGERHIGEVIVQIGVAMVVLPLLIILIVFMIRSYIHPEAVNELASKTIDAMVLYFAEKLPYVILSDLAGTIVGSITGAFQRK